MDESKYKSQIERLSSLMTHDKLSPDEQDINILKKYYDFAKTNFKLSDEAALQLFYEALLFFKLQNVDASDPLQDADKFGGGFS
ncbi:MAG: hypothetical protein NPMRTH4_540008 [Nitrosopumilales archaeon]|nr:MAG: hypothetical protein NPMRTH4_540008 [Nitrosopumilales archaeon]